MRDKIIVLTHLGLGDMICCYSIVRAVMDNVAHTVIVPCKEKYVNSLKHLYSSETRIVLLSMAVPDNNIGSELATVLNYGQQNNIDIIQIGFNNVREPFHYKQFFDQVSVPYQTSWDRFPDFQSTPQSKQLYDSLENKDYALVINTNSYGSYDLKIDTDLPQLKMYDANLGLGIFDWLDVIKNAKEIHSVGTGPFHLIDRIKKFNYNCELYFHNVRQDYHTVDTHWDWKLIDY